MSHKHAAASFQCPLFDIQLLSRMITLRNEDSCAVLAALTKTIMGENIDALHMWNKMTSDKLRSVINDSMRQPFSLGEFQRELGNGLYHEKLVTLRTLALARRLGLTWSQRPRVNR